MLIICSPISGATIKNIFFVVSYSRVENFQLVNSGTHGLTKSVRNGSGDGTKWWFYKSNSRSKK
jgi:hypothetical protein